MPSLSKINFYLKKAALTGHERMCGEASWPESGGKSSAGNATVREHGVSSEGSML